MASSVDPSNSSKKPFKLSVRWRLLAIVIMVIGAAGFIAGLIFFNQQLSCLAGSTLVTIGGLALNIVAKRKGWTMVQTKSDVPETRAASASRWLNRSRVPRGLRGPARTNVPVQAPMAVEPDMSAKKEKRTAPAWKSTGLLADRVVGILEGQGARVGIESLADGRGIFGITTANGQRYVVMVLEDGSPVEARDVRSLLALIRGSGSVRGYLIASGRISQNAYQWSEGRPQIRLVAADELDELSI